MIVEFQRLRSEYDEKHMALIGEINNHNEELTGLTNELFGLIDKKY
jgi:hypothetical protein